MAWWDSVGDGWLNDSSSSNWWSDIGEGWMGGDSDSIDWGDLGWDWLDSGGDTGGGDSGWLNQVGKWFAGGDGNGGSNGENIFGALLGGLGGAAEGLISERAVEKAGEEQRKTYSFQAELSDFYNQKDKSRKRAALDTYGQFSLLDRWAPNTVNTPGIDVPTKPQA